MYTVFRIYGDCVRYGQIYRSKCKQRADKHRNSRRICKNDLEEKISNELLYGSTLTDEKVEYEKIDNETINVKLEMDFIQNIATSQPISADTEGEEILDKQTD